MSDKAYYCLICQVPVMLRAIQAGAHAGHLITEFEGQGAVCDTDRSLLRMFREKMEAIKRYRHLWARQGV